MAVLVYVDHTNGKFAKSANEAVFYGAKVAAATSTDCVAVAIGADSDANLAALGKYGASKVVKVNPGNLGGFDAQAYTKIIATVAENTGADTIVTANNINSKHVAPRLAARLQAALVTGAVDFPTPEGSTWVIKRTAFSGKGFAYVEMNAAKRIIAIQTNSFSPEATGPDAAVEAMDVALTDQDLRITVKEVQKASDKIPLTEASLVVSAGRGMKGPENWGMIEELAEVLGAGTACSRPVSDTGWRPHSEHVGQTGITIRPNLYIAIGISGAIQHLAGVNGSKHIVVINTDPEAPFFQAADYGIVGDAFQVVPKLIEAFRKFKEST